MQQFGEYPQIFLQTGDCYLAVRPTMVTTVLGSCVAVIMTAPEREIGVICHAFLPDSTEATRFTGAGLQACRFVDKALEIMFDSMRRLKLSPSEMEVKIFGGASGIAVRSMEHTTFDVGRRNVEMARNILKQEGATIAVMDVGGSQGRKLHYLTHTGEVWLKRLKKTDDQTANGILPGNKL